MQQSDGKSRRKTGVVMAKLPRLRCLVPSDIISGGHCKYSVLYNQQDVFRANPSIRTRELKSRKIVVDT